MKLTVFGASGRIGGHVVTQALDRGYTVTAVVRDRAAIDVSHPSLEVISVPGLTDPAPLEPALAGSDAAISGIGPRSRKDGPVATNATRVIVPALEACGVRRFVAVSAVPVGPIPDGEGWLSRHVAYPLIRAMLRDTYADLAVMEEEIGRSRLEWTVVRPPRLVDKALSGNYRTAIGGNVARGGTIGRADVAHAMLAALDNPAMLNQAVGVAV
jgi:putative NADH-flavin reductase